MTTPHCFQIEPFQLGQYHDDQAALEARFTNFWAGVSYPVRLISRARRWSFAPIQQRLRAQLGPLEDVAELLPLLQAAIDNAAAFPAFQDQLQRRQETLLRAMAGLPDAETVAWLLASIVRGETTPNQLRQVHDACLRAAWPWRWLKNQRRMYHTIEDHAPPLAIEHYLLAWPDAHVHPGTLAQTLKHTFLVPSVTLEPLPPLFTGRYREEADYFAPLDPGQPYLAVLSGWDVRGEWDLGSLAPLLMGEHALTLAIDIQTLPRGSALRKATDAHTVLSEAVYGTYAVKDARSERALHAVNQVLHQMDQQALHEVAYAVLVEAPTLAALNREIQTIRDQLGVRLRLDRVVGAQAAYLSLFTPQPSRDLPLPIVRRNTLSHGVAVKTPWGLKKTTTITGTLWGYDVDEGMPIHYDPFGQTGVENAHLLMVGRAGSGKTVTLLTLALRNAIAGTQIVHFDPIGKGHLLCQAVGPGAAYYEVATDAAINILDPASAQLDRQIGIVTGKLRLLLGRTEQRGGRIHFTPRLFTNEEQGAIDLACQTDHLYGRDGLRLQTMTPETAPILEVLVAALRAVATTRTLPEADVLAREIELALLGSRAHLFNRPTTLKWDFGNQVISYNFKDADPTLLPLYYAHAFDALNRWVRSAARARRTQPLIVIIDEYFYMASVPELEAEVALATKTWRNYHAAMWTADQNATTYFGQEGLPSEWGPFTANNTLIKLFFRQEGSEADVLGTAYRDHLHAGHVQTIKTGGTGECIALLGDTVHHLQVQLTDLESAYVLRTTTQ